MDIEVKIMEKSTLSSWTVGAEIAYIVAVWLNGILVPIKELVHPFFDFMKAWPPLYHHWATQGLWLLIVFFAITLYYGYKPELANKPWVSKLNGWMIWSTVLSGLIIFIYNYGHAILKLWGN